MRILRLLLLLLIASAACVSQTPQQARRDFQADLGTPAAVEINGDYAQPNLLAMNSASTRPELATGVLAPIPPPDDHTCFFIRSYIMKREGESGATHLDHVTTCTPKSRIRMKTRVKFTPAVDK